MKKIFLSLFIVMIVLTGCGEANSQDPLADGVLTVGMEADYTPYNWTTTQEQGTEYAQPIANSSAYADGYDVRVAQFVADDLGVELEIKKMSWDGLIPGLMSGEIDAVIAGMSPTEERKEQINFTDAYYEDNPEQVIIVNKDSQYASATSLNDLSGANITAQQGTFQVDLLDQIDLAQDAQDPLPDYASLIQAAKSQTIDGYVVEKPSAESQLEANDDLIALDLQTGFEMDPSMTTSAVGVAKENTQLVEQINTSLSKITAEQREQWMQEAIALSGEGEE